MVRFLLTADWHIGMPAYFLGDEAAPRYAADRLAAVQAAGRIAREQGCAFALACGDLFHATFVSRQTVNRLVHTMADFPVPLYILPGNHDPLEPGSVYRRPEFRVPPHVRLLDKPGLVAVPEVPGVEILAAPCLAKHATRDLAAMACASVEPVTAATLRILAAHGAVDRFLPADRVLPDVIEIAAIRRAIEDGRIQVAGLGDRHSTTDLWDGRIWYPGSPETTAFDEADPGNVLVVTLDDGRCEVVAHRVGSWCFLRRPFDVAGDDSLGELGAWLQALPDKGRTAVRLALHGTVGFRGRQALDGLVSGLDGVLASLEVDEGDFTVMPDDFDFDKLALGGYAASAVRELLGTAQGGDRVARDALSLLFRLAGTGVA